MSQRVHHPHLPRTSVGNRKIDSAHREVFDIIHRIQLSFRACRHEDIFEDFRLLEEALQACFSLEEWIAQSVGFDFTTHREMHQGMLKRHQRAREEILVAGDGTLHSAKLDAYTGYLNDWLVRHLDHESEPLRILLDTYIYDFVPDES